MKKYFITGLLIWVPLGITLWVLHFLVSTLDQSLLLLPENARPEHWLGFRIPGLGAIVLLLVVLGTGVFATNILGQRLLRLWEGVLARIPVVKSIYSSVKQVSDMLFSSKGDAFRKVLLVRYPHPEAWSLAFQTTMPPEVAGGIEGEYVAVFIPTTPSPVNGFYFFVKKDEVIEVDMRVDQALKYIVSMGAMVPERRRGPDDRRHVLDIAHDPAEDHREGNEDRRRNA